MRFWNIPGCGQSRGLNRRSAPRGEKQGIGRSRGCEWVEEHGRDYNNSILLSILILLMGKELDGQASQDWDEHILRRRSHTDQQDHAAADDDDYGHRTA